MQQRYQGGRFTLRRRPCIPRPVSRALILISSVVLTVLLYLSLRSSSVLDPKFLFSHSTKFSSGVIQPGDFTDLTRQRTLPLDEGEIPVDEPDGTGSRHDVREGMFYHGGTKSLTFNTSSDPTPVVYDPYPVYNSWSWHKSWKGIFHPCMGPRGTDLNRSHPGDMVSVYKGNQKGFPFPMFGSYEALGLDNSVCADRVSRLAAYGYGENNSLVPAGPEGPSNVTWDTVDWRYLQLQCLERNAGRYEPDQTSGRLDRKGFSITSRKIVQSARFADPTPSSPQYKPRSAVLIRSWLNLQWTQNHVQYLRSLIMELSLHSGGEYEVFLLVHVQDDSLPIWSDPATVEELKQSFVPAEFRNMTIFFNTKMLEAWYPKLEEHRPQYQHLQPVQIFSQLYPDFDYYWQFEMDARYTGHMYQFLEKAVDFAREQPRKYLWERNAYFYTPGAHGDWSNFTQMVNDSMVGKRSVWGPVRIEGIQPIGPNPPVPNPKDDNYEWGVEEEADLITFLPIFDPRETTWTFPNILWNFPIETPRRASPITMWRLSKRMLDLMHHAQATKGLGVVSEMTGPSWALWHGLKAVHVPHPLFVDGKWSSREIARIYNRGSPEKINGGPDSIWNFDHGFDQIMYRTTYMFTTQTAEDLYRRWLGYAAENDEKRNYVDAWGRRWNEGGLLEEHIYGHLCFPPMLMHTVKNTDLQKGWEMAVPV